MGQYDYGDLRNIPDCVESVLHNLFDLILYDVNTKEYNFNLMPESIKLSFALRDFYAQYPLNETQYHEARQAWFNLIAGLRDKSEKIEYHRDVCEAYGNVENILTIISVLIGKEIGTLEELGRVLSTDTRMIVFEKDFTDQDKYIMTISEKDAQRIV